MGSDLEHHAAVNAYKVPLIRDAYPQRCLFIIDPDGILRYVNYQYRIDDDYPDVMKTLEAIKKKRENRVPRFHAPEVVRALDGLDPIELVEGRKVPGLEKHTFTRRQYQYLFSTEVNRKRFEQNPARYEIQLGGGCGRMGPLSGWGAPDRFEVYNGGIYIFASESCRKGFLSAPEDHLDHLDPVPAATRNAMKKGETLLASAIVAMGGAERIDGVKSFSARYTKTEEYQGRDVDSGSAWTYEFSGKIRKDSFWDTWSRSEILNGEDGFILNDYTIWTMHPSERFLFEKMASRNLLAILKARLRKDFQAVALGTAKRENQGIEKVVDQVAVSYGGNTTTLGIDQATGKIVSLAYRGRPGIGPNGEIMEILADFREEEGLTLPFSRQVLFNGKPVDGQSFTWTTIEVNGEIEKSLFERPPVK